MNRKKLLSIIIIFTALVVLFLIFSKPAKRYNSLIIGQTEWDSIKSSRIENKSLFLENIEFNGNIVFIDELSNKLYYSLVNNSQTKYNPQIKFHASTPGVRIAVLKDEISSDKVKNNYDFELMIYNGNSYRTYKLRCTELPILSIDYVKNPKNNHIPMNMYLFNNLANTPNKVTVSVGKINIEDDNFELMLDYLTPGKNRRDNVISILGMQPSDKYILTPVTSENNTDSVSSSELVNKDNRVELIMNNIYRGVHTIEVMPKK